MIRFTRKRVITCASIFAVFAIAASVFAILRGGAASAATDTTSLWVGGSVANTNYFKMKIDGQEQEAWCADSNKATPWGSNSGWHDTYWASASDTEHPLELYTVSVDENSSLMDKKIFGAMYVGSLLYPVKLNQSGYDVNAYSRAVAIHNALNDAADDASAGNSGYALGNSLYADVLTRINNGTLFDGIKDAKYYIAGTQNVYLSWQRIMTFSYSDQVEEHFNLSVSKIWGDQDIDSDIYDTFNNNNATNYVPHSMDIRLNFVAKVTYNGITKDLRTWEVGQSDNFSKSENNISCRAIKSDLFDVVGDYTCSGLTVTMTESPVQRIYQSPELYSARVTPEGAITVTDGGNVNFLFDNMFYTTEVGVNKTWQDKNNSTNNERPSYITFDIKYRLASMTSDNWAAFKTYTVETNCSIKKRTSQDQSEIDAACSATNEPFTFDNLPAFLKFNDQYRLVEYKAFETKLYDANHNDITDRYEKIETAYTVANTEHGRTATEGITNSDLFDLPVWKVWYGDRNLESDRPNEIVAALMCDDDTDGDGVADPTAVLDGNGDPMEISLSNANNWENKFEGLSKYACGSYRVEEKDIPANYTNTATYENGIWVLRNYHDIDVKVTKVWNGTLDNTPDVQDLDVALVCAGDETEVIDTVTLNESNSWSYTWTGRDYRECGDGGDEYAVKEVGYTGSYTFSGFTKSQDQDGTWVYTMRNSKSLDIPVEKAWATRSDDIRTTETKVILLCASAIYGDTEPYLDENGNKAILTLNAGNDWRGTFTNIENNSYSNCKYYSVGEVKIDDPDAYYGEGDTVTATTASAGDFKFKVHYSGDPANGFTITNEQLIDIPVEKDWDDLGNGSTPDNDRPRSIVALLYCERNGHKTVVDNWTLDADNNWSYTWTDLETSKCDSYSIGEAPYSEHGYGNTFYEYSVSGNENDGFVLTNTKYEKLTVMKVWNYQDPSNKPSEISITLTCNGADFGQPVVLTEQENMTASGSWIYNGFNHLKSSDCPTGYSVREIIDPQYNYTSTVEVVTTSGSPVHVIKNNEEITVPVEKIWDTGRSIEDLPASVDVTLYCTAGNAKAMVDTITLYKADNYAGEFGPYTYGSCEGEYSVEEEELVGFEATYSGDAVNGFRVTNTEYTHLEVNKTWEKRDTTQVPNYIILNLTCNDDPENVRYIGKSVFVRPDDNGNWSHDFQNLKTSECSNYGVEERLPGNASNFVLTENAKSGNTVNLTNTEQIYVPVKKQWEASENDTLPETIDVTLYCRVNGVDTKVDEATLEAPFYDHEFGPYQITDCEGTYVAAEEPEVEGFDVTGGEMDEEGRIELTNTKQYDINVSKNWEVTPGKQIDLPSSITVALWCETSDSEVQGKRISLQEDDNYAGGWTGLSYAACASYGVREVAADGTTILSTVGDRYNDFFFYGGVSGSAAEGFTLTNTYDGIEISGTKTWNYTDVNGNVQTESKRPSQISVKLLQNGSVIDTVAVSADNDGNWDYSFDDQPKYDAEGNEYTYTVDEALVTYYQKTINGYNITNQYAPEYTSVTASKDWAALKDTTLPAQVEVRLYCGTTDLNQAKYITKASNWASVTWENLPVDGCDDGYNVKEITPAGFTPSVAVVGDTNYNFTNSEEVDIPVSKTWVKRESTSLPESVTVGLYCTVNSNKTKLDEQTLSEANNWSYTWTDRSVKNDNCQGGAYSVDEISTVPNFKKTSVDYTTANGYVITNTETTSQKVIKVWNGDTDQNRPGSITAELMCGDTVKKTQILSEANNLDHDNTWEYTWEDLLISDCEQGYTVRESFNIPNYKTSYETLEDGTVVITNERTTSQKVIKVWKNDDKTKRPGYIEASLKCGNEVIDTVKLSEENNLDGDDTWEYEWNDLLVSECEEGYTVDEDINIPNYHKTVTVLEDGTVVITNEFDNPDTSDKKFGLGGIIGISSAVVLLAGAFATRKFIGRR